MSGDIEGWARWTVTPHGGGSLARYEQVVDVNKPLLRRFAVPGRPIFRANHWLMMRAGRRGLDWPYLAQAVMAKRFEGNAPGPVLFTAFPGD